MKNIFLSLFLILFFWALFVPSLEFPDEQAHFATVSLLSEQTKMPKGNQIDVSRELALTEEVLGTLRDRSGNNRYTYHPENMHILSGQVYGPREGEILNANTTPNRQTYEFKEAARYPFLYYTYSGLFYKSVFDQSIFDRLFAVRLGSVLLGLANLWMAKQIGEELFGSSIKSTILAFLVGLQPMMTFVMSGVNSDVLHNLLFSGILLFCLRFIKYNQAADSLFYILVLTGLDFITKPQAYIAIPTILIAFLIRFITKKNIRQNLIYLFSFAVVILLALYIFQKNYLLQFIATGKLPYLNSVVNPNAPAFWDYARYSLDRLIHQNIVWYWGVFKWLGVVLPRPLWWVANRLVLISLVGLVVGMFKNFSKSQKSAIAFLGLSSAIYILSIFWYDWTYIRATSVQVAVQARYYFPTLVAHMALLYLGLLGFSSKEKYQSIVSKILVGFFIVLQISGIYTIARSYYDLSSFQSLITQASQYKPIYAKGIMWWIWGSTYLASLGYIAFKALTFKSEEEQAT